MREIKFRGKRINDKEWVFGAYFSDDKRHYIVTRINDIQHAVYGYRSNDVELYVVDPATVGQYTDLPDCNGVNIAEGDILRIYDDLCGDKPEPTDYIDTEVYWNEVGQCLAAEWDFGDYDETAIGWAYGYWKAIGCRVEIIGNRYEKGGKADAD